jgi:hypothetical protein
MAEAKPQPRGWNLAFESTTYQEFAERQYTRIRYDRSDGEGSVFVHDVQEPNSYGGWGYLVHATGTDGGNLGLVDDLEAAKDLAAEFMTEHA